MKIAVATTRETPNAHISKHGARAPYYQFYDTEDGLIETLPNPAANMDRGAGPRAASILIDKAVDRVVAEDFGFYFMKRLEAAGISCIKSSGEISDAIYKQKQQIAGYRLSE